MLPTITIDIGTTSVKLCQFDAESQLVFTAKVATPVSHDEHGEVYDLPVLRNEIINFIRTLDAARRASVSAIAITGVGESGGLVRSDLSLASPMILWHDQRGADRVKRLTAEERTRLYRISGLPANANYGLSKTAWALENATDLADAKWLNIAEYLAAWMTAERWSEPSLASRTMALDLMTEQWSAEATGMFGVDTSIYPGLRPATQGTQITPSFAAETGLDSSALVHVAGHDHMVGGVGAELAAGELLNSTGTTEGLLIRSSTPHLGAEAEEAKLANGLDCAGNGYTLFASIPTGGSAFATLQRMLGLDAARLSEVVDRLHEQYLRGEVDLDRIPIVVPQFRGSPPPTKRSTARGLIAGIGDDTTLEDVVFGTFVGLALEFRDVLELFQTSISQMKVIGPASGNSLWLQLKADVLGTPLSASRFPEVVSRGAQTLASNTTWLWPHNEPHSVDPDDGRHRRMSAWAAEVGDRRRQLRRLSE